MKQNRADFERDYRQNISQKTEVKRSVGKDKKEWVDHIARGAGEAASH